MPSFPDSIFIFILALILFGPKKLPEIARWLGKLMAEFRRASNEFRIQMEDELRMAEQAETQKKFAAQNAPETPALTDGHTTETTDHDTTTYDAYGADSGHAASSGAESAAVTEHSIYDHSADNPTPDGLYKDLLDEDEVAAAPAPIATSGDLSIHPPATGLPVPAHASATEPAANTTENATHD